MGKEIKERKRAVFGADPHCGAENGLTPPQWQYTFHPRSKSRRSKLAKMQRQMWERYAGWLEEIKPVRVGIWPGDCIAGKEKKQGGRGLITADRNEQTDMAAAVIEEADADVNIMTYGTGYHVGTDDDWEDSVASKVGAEKIGGHEWVDINGVIFDVKHKVGSSSIPHGRFTAIAKERLWNVLWAEREQYPKADVIVRGHVHYHTHCGDSRWLGLTLPALQGPGGIYGVRECSGTVDFGLVYFDVEPDGRYSWEAKLCEVGPKKIKPFRV